VAIYGKEGGRPRRRVWRLFDALFDEAWELGRERRRRRALAWLLALAAGGAVYLGLTLAPGQPNRPTPVPVAAITRGPVSSETLPRAGQYSSLAAIGGKLIVWGGNEGNIDSVPAATSTGATCQAAQVDPATLALVAVRHGNCLNPLLYRERVLPDLVTTRGGTTGDIAAVRISVTSTIARGGYTLGPVLLRYEQCSDCGLSTAYGDGSLWIYAPNALGGSHTAGRLLRISEQTGQLVQRWSLPPLYQALLATDRNGLWIAPSLFSGDPQHASVAQRRDDESLYRVSAGMRTPDRAFLVGPNGARWLVASESTVWLQTGTPAATRLIRLNGPNARRAFSTREHLPPTCLALGKGPSSIAGDKTGGIYCVGANSTGTGMVYRFSARSGTGHQVASIPGVATTQFEQPAAIMGDTYFFLEPPTFSYGPGPSEKATAHGPGVLYRVRAH
jgi:hypothetical protein